MREAKENMRLAMQLTNNLIQQCRLPFVTEFVNLYTVIFDELSKCSLKNRANGCKLS